LLKPKSHGKISPQTDQIASELDIHDATMEAMAEILEEKGTFNHEEWERRVQKKLTLIQRRKNNHNCRDCRGFILFLLISIASACLAITAVFVSIDPKLSYLVSVLLITAHIIFVIAVALAVHCFSKKAS
jgi:hypothetical protein